MKAILPVNSLPAGRYVIAVSGGVDSVVLLHMLRTRLDIELIVAHFDHGIRDDSKHDRLFVQGLAEQYGLACVYDEGKLGQDASEATARHARYAFLRRVMKASKAQTVLTAHHQDDVIETALLNLLRGTGRKGLTSLASRKHIVRPLLDTPKQALITYASQHELLWREDSTNQNDAYLRNAIRHKLVPRLADDKRRELLDLIKNMQRINTDIDELLQDMLNRQPKPTALDRQQFIMLPHNVAKELLAAWLRANDVRDFDRKSLERIVVQAKTLPSNKVVNVMRGVSILTHAKTLALQTAER